MTERSKSCKDLKMLKHVEIGKKIIYVTDDGKVFNAHKKELKQQVWKTGYKYVRIAGHNMSVHRLIAMAFLSGYSEKIQVHHINNVRSDNKVENLRIMTLLEHQRLHKQILPTVKICVVCGKKFIPNETKRRRAKVCSAICKVKLDKINAEKRQRPINQLSLEKEFIKKWDSARQVQITLSFYESNINKCCNGVINSYKGFIWRYV